MILSCFSAVIHAHFFGRHGTLYPKLSYEYGFCWWNRSIDIFGAKQTFDTNRPISVVLTSYLFFVADISSFVHSIIIPSVAKKATFRSFAFLPFALRRARCLYHQLSVNHASVLSWSLIALLELLQYYSTTLSSTHLLVYVWTIAQISPGDSRKEAYVWLLYITFHVVLWMWSLLE